MSPLVMRLAVDAPCSVLVVDQKSAAPTGAAVSITIIAVTVLRASLAAAEHAFALARTVGAQGTVVHVLREHWEEPQRHDQNVDEARQFLEHHFRRLLQIAVSTAPRSESRSRRSRRQRSALRRDRTPGDVSRVPI